MAFTSLVKNINEQSVIACMRDGKMHTKQELARLTNLSFPTVGKLVEELVRRGMLLLVGTDMESQGGRKAEVYQMNRDFAHVLLLFLQGETVYCGICNALGEMLVKWEKKGRVEQHLKNKSSSLLLLRESIKNALAENEKIAAIAVGLPGSVRDGVVYCMDGYEGMMGRNIEAELSLFAKVPVKVSNNMSIIARGMAEMKKKEYEGQKDRGRMEDTIACIHLAETGPGFGAVVNGKPLQGFSGFQGEIGFMPLYGERNLQEVALGGFAGVIPGEYMGKMIACICTILNPGQIVCYMERDWNNLCEETMRYCRAFLPEYAVPQLIFDRNYREDYLYGLTVMGCELIYQEEK